MHQPGTEPGPHRWHRCILPLDHWCPANFLQTLRHQAHDPPPPPADERLQGLGTAAEYTQPGPGWQPWVFSGSKSQHVRIFPPEQVTVFPGGKTLKRPAPPKPEVMATNAKPELHLPSIKKFAKDLVLLFAFHLAERISSLLRQALDHPKKVLYDPESEVLFLPQFWLLPIYRELLNTASRNRPSRDSELRRSASGLVKALCKPSDSAAGGKGKRKGKLLKQGSALARFDGWFGSMSLMNTLYVWFPASWGPSVVEAIKRNQTWLAQNPVHRDPVMFNATEVEMGPPARAMTYKIQKWNVRSERVRPILVANTRVDWLALDDAEISRNFPILLEGPSAPRQWHSGTVA